ncbi:MULTISPECIES: hypothetical protein [Bacillus]|uniref:hypothetical protein n=1 Tax=Bacillus TaxID=1386 RepID=UPI0013EE72E5|nr:MULTISPECIES: hypothetical protein [Bacillus]KAF6545598.1 hypothetical protein G9F51_14545 [Bacillus sp. EKM207B]KAF6546563.1 hypothetical protein G9F50_13010 [Bacillus sp. EKM206B]KAF6554891.1 hypothetical protein G9F47_12440 [Bacillus sp. EKM203B]MBL3611710.1 hypothetical protein [Bacillus sp. RHFS18]
MSKAVYIGSTPKDMTREANENALEEISIKSKEIQNRLMKMKNKMKNKEIYDAES